MPAVTVTPDPASRAEDIAAIGAPIKTQPYSGLSECSRTGVIVTMSTTA
jgi:hypothetical protein